MVEPHHSISMAGSTLSWDEIDEHAHSKGFRERSKYIQYLVEKDIYKTKKNYSQTLVIILLLILAMLSLAILMRG